MVYEKYICGHIIKDNPDFIEGDYIINDMKMDNLKCDVCKNNLISGINIDVDYESQNTHRELRCINCVDLTYLKCMLCNNKCKFLNFGCNESEFENVPDYCIGINYFKYLHLCEKICYQLGCFGSTGGFPIYFYCNNCEKEYSISDL